ncbi:MAG: sugar transferase, partial [Acidimicrobiia bacterium]|nr:sugar transferase [Acidimicrobiia bacterium]
RSSWGTCAGSKAVTPEMTATADESAADIAAAPPHPIEFPLPDGVSLYPRADVFAGERRSAALLNPRKTALFLGDLLAVSLGLLASIALHSAINPTDPVSGVRYFLLLYVSLPIWPVLFTNQSLYKARFISRGVDEGWRIIKAVAAALVGIAVLSIMTKSELARTWYIIAFPSVIFLVGVERIFARVMFARSRQQGRMLRRVVIVGRNDEGHLVREMLDSDLSHGYRVAGFVEDYLDPDSGHTEAELLGDPERTVEVVRDTDSVGVIIAATAIDVGTSNRLIRTLTENGIHVELSSTLCDIAADRLTIRPLGRFPMVYIEPIRRHGWRAVAKRVFDLSTAALLLLVTLPIQALAMLAIKLNSPGPVFFKQQRVGRDGDLFWVYKLRTMVVGAEDLLENVRHLNEANGPLFKIKDDPRITSVGHLLRKTSVDELPQLINVIKGEMSLVGPRPALPEEVAEWEPTLFNRLRVQPGITGMWQVNGRSESDEGDYGQLDLYYVDNWTLYTDVSILVRTVPAVLLQRGAH